ncbi:hypothetical protein IJS77_05000 [bacterium]|nr:hypothetical protein [bacterium]
MKVEKMKKIFLIILMIFMSAFMTANSVFSAPKPLEVEYDTEYYKELKKVYKGVTTDESVIDALEILKNTHGVYSYKAIMGENLTGKKIKIEMKDLSEISPNYRDFDALGWKKNERLFIYVNKKHNDAPPEALAALLAHEALHQDEFNSINEETYAWTYEASIFTKFVQKDESLLEIHHPLVTRENTLRKLFIKGNYTSEYIRKAVKSNKGYATLPSRSPGFEDENL